MANKLNYWIDDPSRSRYYSKKHNVDGLLMEVFNYRYKCVIHLKTSEEGSKYERITYASYEKALQDLVRIEYA